MSKDLHLPPDYHEQVVGILRRNAPEIEVWAYGSRIDGSNHDASDLDLVLRTPGQTPVSVSAISRLHDAFDESNPPIIVDISRLGATTRDAPRRGPTQLITCWFSLNKDITAIPESRRCGTRMAEGIVGRVAV